MTLSEPIDKRDRRNLDNRLVVIADNTSLAADP